MSRPLRIDYEGAWYHVMNRGIERRAVFQDDDDRRAYLRLLSELEENFGVEVHGYCLMANHYHLVLHTPKANLSRAMRWLGQSYSQRFNRRHDRVGPLFQGRFKSVPVDPNEWLLELSVYVHLNPLRIARLGLGKPEDKRESMGIGERPEVKEVNQRLQELRRYTWSSYRYYAGHRAAPEWMKTQWILGRLGKKGAERRAEYRRLIRDRLKRGTEESIIEKIREEVALGSAAFVEEIRERFSGKLNRETSGHRKMAREIDLELIITCVEAVKEEPREKWLKRHGDDGKWIVMFMGRHRTGLTLRELGKALGGVDYVAVSMGVKRFEKKLEMNKEAKKRLEDVVKLLKVKT